MIIPAIQNFKKYFYKKIMNLENNRKKENTYSITMKIEL